MIGQKERLRNALENMEKAAQQLIAQAECVQISTTDWVRRNHRVDLLQYARQYASAVNIVTHVRK